MARYHGITGTSTFDRILVDSGQIRLNYVDAASPGTLIGATKGGSVFSLEREIKDLGIDGQKGVTKGARRVTKVGAKLTCNFISLSSDIIRMAIPGSSETNHPLVSPTHREIKAALDIALSDYLSSIAILGEVMGSTVPIIIILKNCLCDGNFELSFSDGEESVLPVQFTAHFDPTAMDTEPYTIRYPGDIDTTTV